MKKQNKKTGTAFALSVIAAVLPLTGKRNTEEKTGKDKAMTTDPASHGKQEKLFRHLFGVAPGSALTQERRAEAAKLRALLRQGFPAALCDDLAFTDVLTGLRNRRGLATALAGEINRCRNGVSGDGLLVMIAVDSFSSVCDTHGPMAGEACLRLVARTLAGEIRACDTAARIAGDEFVLLLSNTGKDRAAGRARELAWRLGNLSVAWYGDEIPVRASLGMRSCGAGDDPDSILAAAALWRGATGGKGRVMHA